MNQPFNPINERIKWKYFRFETNANGKSPKTMDKIRKALHRYEKFTQYESFKSFNDRKAMDYKEYLIAAKGVSGDNLSLITISHALRSLQSFLKWLSLIPGYKRSIDLLDIEYLNLSEKDRRRVRTEKLKEYPSFEQIHIV